MMGCTMKTAGLVALLAVSCSGCVSVKKFRQLQDEVKSVDAEVQAVDRKVDGANQRIDNLKGLTADMEAVRGYFLEVKETIRQMRDETGALLDEYRVGIEETRAGYIKALKGQQRSIQVLIEELEQNGSAGEGRVPDEAERSRTGAAEEAEEVSR